MLEPERILRLEEDAVVLLDQRRAPARGSRGSLSDRGRARGRHQDDGRPRRARDRRRRRVRHRARGGHRRGPGRGRSRPARVAADRGQSRVGARRDARRPVARARAPDPRRRGRPLPSHGGARRGALRRRARARSRTATPAGSRPAATAVRSVRCSRRGSAGCSSTCGSTRRGRCSRAPASPRGSSKTASIPHSVIADSAAASLMAAGEVECVITGADRIAANGDTANKIGTYSLAVLASHHGIPFYVVAPDDHARPEHAGRRGDPDRGTRSRARSRPVSRRATPPSTSRPQR